MLKKLFIRNYILIDELDIQFGNGLTIITGETGAGKSILLGALSLILGQRADTGSLLDKKKKCIVEGVFLSENDLLAKFCEEHELDYDSEVCLRREINAEGKSRAFINDTPVNLNVLRELSAILIDVHSQHETLTLANSSFQLSVVDAFAGQHKQSEFHQQFAVWQKLKKELQRLIESEQKAKSDLDYNQFQYDELEQAKLQIDEQDQLERELQALTHAEEIRQQLEKVNNLIDGAEGNILQQLASLSLSGIAKYDEKYSALSERIRSAAIELKDIGSEAEQLAVAVNPDPSKAELINERLNTIYRLQHKHRVNSIEALLQLQNDLEKKLTGISSLEKQINELTILIEKHFRELSAKAMKISAKRMHVIPEIEKSIKKLLAELAMPNAMLKVHNEVLAPEEMNENGIDRISFYFSANKGGELKELGKVASGGEFSRLMLAIKSIMAGLASLPTIIFDEIDTGVSGEVAARVGAIMQKMAVNHQVIAITHLPQIAGKGNEHYVVFKTDSKTETRTGIRQLSNEERIQEIARMLSGQKLTGAAIEHAKELLSI